MEPQGPERDRFPERGRAAQAIGEGAQRPEPAPQESPGSARTPWPAEPTRLLVHSTRLFPKGYGAGAYRLSGIAARCDWVVLSDERPPHTLLLERRPGGRPRHVFLSLRQPFAALAFFRQQVLPRIEAPFRLISGSEDITLPLQTDRRWRPFDPWEQQTIAAILADARVLSWAAENLVRRDHPKWMPLPLGLTFPHASSTAAPTATPNNGEDPRLVVPNSPRQALRPLRLLCAHRLRSGPQWDLRRQVHQLCREQLPAWSTVIDDEVAERRFLQLLRLHAFVICAEGGGLDPSPKAWQALLQGAIPIVRRSALDGAYGLLPVAFVEDWRPEELAWERLREWQQQLMPWFDEGPRRAEVLHRLSLPYWWQRILAYEPQPTGEITRAPSLGLQWRDADQQVHRVPAQGDLPE